MPKTNRIAKIINAEIRIERKILNASRRDVMKQRCELDECNRALEIVGRQHSTLREQLEAEQKRCADWLSHLENLHSDRETGLAQLLRQYVAFCDEGVITDRNVDAIRDEIRALERFAPSVDEIDIHATQDGSMEIRVPITSFDPNRVAKVKANSGNLYGIISPSTL